MQNIIDIKQLSIVVINNQWSLSFDDKLVIG